MAQSAPPLCGQTANTPPGLGGTGSPQGLALQHPGGLGGTGQVAESGEGGLGGTGVVGVITGFGSICVNGLKVEYPANALVWRDGQPVEVGSLAVGQWVALQALGQGSRWQTGQIVVLDAAVGPLGALDRRTGRFALMGQQAVALNTGDLADLEVGQWVRVSGQRLANGEIRATKVQTAAPGEAWLLGPLGVQEPGRWRIGGAWVVPGASQLASGLETGQEVGVRGVWMQDRLVASSVTIRPTRSAWAGSDRVLLQGYVHRIEGRELSLGFEDVTLGAGTRLVGGRMDRVKPGQAVLVQGRLNAQRRVQVDRLEFRSESGRSSGRGRGSSDDGGGDDDRSGSGSDDSGSRSGSDSSGSGSGSSGGDSGGRGRGRGRGGD